VAEIVKRLHRIYVKAYAALAQQLDKLGIAAPALVTGNVERHYPLFSESFKRLVHGRGTLSFNIHRDFTPYQTKCRLKTRQSRIQNLQTSLIYRTDPNPTG
jgi:hypothetical protein